MGIERRQDEAVARLTGAWMDLLTLDRQGTGFFGRSRAQKTCREALETLRRDPAETAAFIESYLDGCKGGAYRATAFGLLPRSDEKLQQKIREEVDALTLRLPRRLGLEREAVDVRALFLEHLERK